MLHEIESWKAQAVAAHEQKAWEKENWLAAREVTYQLLNDKKAHQEAEKIVQKILREKKKLFAVNKKAEMAALQKDKKQKTMIKRKQA